MPSDDSPQDARLRRRHLRRRLQQSADTADAAGFLSLHTQTELLSRLELITLKPARILDAGAGSGAASRLLARRYRRSRVVSLDLSPGRLALAKRAHGRFARLHEVAGEAGRLPFTADSFDMVFADLLLPWLGEAEAFAAEVRRVLRPEGLFLFSSLGPDSFTELRASWAEVDALPRVREFPDMHELGDTLVRAGLADPVLDVDRLVVTYEAIDKLWRDIVAAGARNTQPGRARGLATPALFRSLAAAYERRRVQGRLPLTLEIVYGHAWSGREPAGASGEVRISPRQIGRRR